MTPITSGRLLLAGFALMLLPGCIKSPLYTNIKLNPLEIASTKQDNPTVGNDGNVTVQAYKLSKKETKNLLGVAIKNSDVIQITVTNGTAVAHELRKSDIDTDLIPVQVITQRIKDRNRTIRDLGITAACYAGLFATYAGVLAAQHLAIIPVSIAAAGVGAGAITGNIVAKKRNKAAANMHSVLKTLSPEVLRIAPSTTESMLIFVDPSITPDLFGITVRPVSQQEHQAYRCMVTV